LILKLDDSLNAASKAIKRRNKLIRIADKTEAGWAAVDEYLSDEVASGFEDGKKIRAAEQRALRKKKNARCAKSGQKLRGFSAVYRVLTLIPHGIQVFWDALGTLFCGPLGLFYYVGATLALSDVKAAASRTFGVLLCEKFWLSAFNSRADNTVINYCKSFCKFKAWCLHSTGEVSFLPATSFTVSLHLHHLLENSLSSSTICGVFYAINWVHKLSVFENPNPCDNFLVRSIVEASSRAPHPSKFSDHSFRSGGATSAANLNVPDRLFKVHGRWKSDSANDGYVRDKVDSRLYVPLHIGI
ncbi:unnamed protein product, partial [Porites lobata]